MSVDAARGGQRKGVDSRTAKAWKAPVSFGHFLKKGGGVVKQAGAGKDLSESSGGIQAKRRAPAAKRGLGCESLPVSPSSLLLSARASALSNPRPRGGSAAGLSPARLTASIDAIGSQTQSLGEFMHAQTCSQPLANAWMGDRAKFSFNLLCSVTACMMRAPEF